MTRQDMDRPGGSDAPRGNRDLSFWLWGSLIALIAVVGVGGFVLYLALYLDVPAWLQVVIGIGLPVAGAALAWLVASALRRSRS